MFRKIITRTILFLLVFAFLVWQGWNEFPLNNGLKNLVVSQLQARLGEACSIEKLRVGLGSVQLSGVNLVFDNSPYQLKVDELRLGYSLISLLKGAGEIQKTAEEITFYKPQLILTYNAKKDTKQEVGLSLDMTEEQEKQYRSLIKEYDFIKKITISEGEIRIHESFSNKSTRVAQKINGWAYTDDRAHALLRVAGHLFESKEYNLVIYGQFNLNSGHLDFVNVDLHDYELGDDVPFVLPNYLDVMEGTVNGQLNVTERREPTRGFNIEGDVKLSNGRMKLVNDNLYFDDMQFVAQIKDWNLYIKNATQNINGSPTKVEGAIKNLLEPELDLRLTAQQLDVDKFLRQFLPQKNIPLKGRSQLDLTFTDSFAHPQISGIVKADSLLLSNYKFTGVETKLTLQNFGMSFDDISGSLKNADISGSGNIDFASPEKLMDFKLVITGDFTNELQALGAPATDHCVGQSQIRIFGPLATPVSRGQFKLFFTEESSQSLALNGSFTYSDRQLTLNTASSDNQFRLNLSAKNLFIAPKFSIDASNFETLFALFPNPELTFVRKHYHLNLSAEGTRSNPSVAIDGYRRDNYEKLFEIATDSAGSRNANTLQGNIALFPNSDQSIPGEFEVDFSTGFKLNRLLLGDRVNGSVELSQKLGGPINGTVLISNFKFSQLNSLLGDVLPHIEGDLFGRIDVDTHQDSPKYFGDLWLFNGFIRQSGPYKGELSFTANSSEIVCRRLSLEKNDATSILAKGQYTLSTQEINADLVARALSVSELIEVVTGETDLVDGTAMIQVSLKGRGPKIPIYGRIDLSNPEILMFKFDDGVFLLGSEYAANGSYLSKDALNIGHAELGKTGAFRLTGQALLPLTNKESIDVRMASDGNFLSLLSDIDPYFEKTSSDGRLDLRLSGNYTRPNFSDSKLSVKNGVMNLTAVARKVENLEADLRVLSGDYFLDVVKLQGDIRNEPFWISNTNVLTGLNHGIYEPLRIAGDDLNLGAILLKTGPHGVPLNIPALMDAGDVGRYQLVGRDTLEQFFVAGPWAHPVVRGEVRINNANLVFPFEESSGDGEYTLVQKILDNLNWDLRAKSIKDTRYVKQFTTGVYVNLEVDPKNSVLDFSGILGDSTFRIAGKVESTRGEFEYIDHTFRVDKFGAEFDHSSLYPMVYGKAWTVVRDTANVPSDVYLELYTLDEANRETAKGRWDRVNIRLSTEFPGYAQTEKDIMATLGYSSDNVEKQATRAVGYSTDKFIFRPIMRPIERQLERRLGLDVVRFSYALTRNFLDANLNNEELGAKLALLRSSRLILGKYLTNDIYVIYTGELKAGVDYRYQDKGVGLQHVVGLEYRLNPRLLLQMEYDYNSLLERQKDDKKIWLRHSFPF